MLFQIKSWIDDSVLFECEVPDSEPLKVKFALQLAVGRKANLRGANLRGAYLDGANLRDAYLRDAYLRGAYLRGQVVIDLGQRSDGYAFFLMNLTGEGWRIKAGCRNFTVAEARTHWQTTRGGTRLGNESLAIVDHAERIAAIRGYDLNEQPAAAQAPANETAAAEASAA